MDKRLFNFRLRISDFIYDILEKEGKSDEDWLFLSLLGYIKTFKKEEDILSFLEWISSSKFLPIKAMGLLIGDVYYQIFEEGKNEEL